MDIHSYVASIVNLVFYIIYMCLSYVPRLDVHICQMVYFPDLATVHNEFKIHGWICTQSSDIFSTLVAVVA